MKSKMLIVSTGLAMFSMFFGSGNLVFPLLVGQLSQGHYVLGALGIFLTGVVVPFLGILAMLLFNGDSTSFFSRLGRRATFWAPLIALSLMGPFGVLARCIAVAHGAFRLLLPETPLWLFSLIGCLILFALTIRKNRIVPVLGSVLTPLLLVALAAIALFSLLGSNLPTPSALGSWASFKQGILQGYQTMDLLAAFFFSAFVIKHLKEQEPNPAASLPIFFKSSLIGAGLLSSIYCVLVLLGAIHADALAHVPPQEMLGTVASLSLGPLAGPVVATTAILACLTTAIVLTSLFADFLKKEVCKDKLPMSVSVATTLAIAFCISTLNFQGIMKVLGPILEYTYPALIVMTVTSIFHKLWGLKIVRTPIAIAVLLKVLSAI
ncbi:MAG TPA: branched-chain amino acid transport system II carrier protein [Chlamydiales bacterium]